MSSEDFDREDRRSIARQHVLGATLWTYGGGGMRVRAWTRFEDFSKFWRVNR